MRRNLIGLAAAAALLVCCSGVASAAATATWVVQSTPLPSGALHGQTSAVSCASSDRCIAVGFAIGGSNAPSALAEQWKGTTWAVQDVPSPAGATSSSLTAVSCTSPNACTAVGDYTGTASTALTLAVRLNGTKWAVQSTPSPAGATASVLSAVSCSSATSCTATGFYQDSAGQFTLAEHWDGSTWTIQDTPSPAGATASFLSGVRCTSADSCIAVGGTGTGVLAEQWNGTIWAIQNVPGPAGATGGQLSAVSCSTAETCIATGSYRNGSGVLQPLAESWNGSAWTIQTVPLPAGAAAGGGLNGVWCVKAAICTAVGSFSKESGVVEALAERWDGSKWRVQATAAPPMGEELDSVSCRASHTCTTVGDDTADGTGQGDALPLTEHE